MNKQKLKLVSIHIKESPHSVPLAAASLKTQLDSHVDIAKLLDVQLCDYYAHNRADYIADDLCADTCKMVGFSTYLWNRELVEKICKIIKTKLPETIVFAGGAEATALPLSLLESAPFDFVIKGEGEIVLLEVMKSFLGNKALDDIAGLFMRDGKHDPDKDQQPVLDLNSLDSPFLSGSLDPAEYSGLLWELSRGCPFKCGFCFESRGVAGVRKFSIDRIKRELELFEEKKVSQVFVLDPTFNSDAARAKLILRMIHKITPLIHFNFEVRTEFLDSEIASLFAEINCTLQIGLQSAHSDVLASVNRTFNAEAFADKISLLNNEGVLFGLDLIFGLPGDTLDGFKESLDYALALQPNHLDIFRLTVLPGTALYDQAGPLDLNALKDAPYTLVSSSTFSESELEQAESLKLACDLFYNRGGAVGWLFMVLEELELNASDFFSGFAEYMVPQKDPDLLKSDDILELQLSFVKKLFAKNNKNIFYPVIEDIIRINNALNRSLYAGPLINADAGIHDDTAIYRLAPGTVTLSLKYDYNDLMSVGELNFEEFLDSFNPQKTCLVVYNCRGIVKSLIITENLIQMLESLDGHLSMENICAVGSEANRMEIWEFLDYAVAEQMIQAC
ncbi:MAG: radical SAM protein [Spirochaetes bacterium]|nr:radical SAM protein [Spirochaetota bacterium]